MSGDHRGRGTDPIISAPIDQQNLGKKLLFPNTRRPVQDPEHSQAMKVFIPFTQPAVRRRRMSHFSHLSWFYLVYHKIMEMGRLLGVQKPSCIRRCQIRQSHRVIHNVKKSNLYFASSFGKWGTNKCVSHRSTLSRTQGG